FTSTRTSIGPGFGSSRSTRFRASFPPCFSMIQAFIFLTESFSDLFRDFFRRNAMEIVKLLGLSGFPEKILDADLHQLRMLLQMRHGLGHARPEAADDRVVFDRNHEVG